MAFFFIRKPTSFNFITDSTTIRTPPTSGPYPYSPPYGTWYPGDAGYLAVGGSYVDPVFGTTIRRLTGLSGGLQAGVEDIYGKRGFWNSDGTYFINRFSDNSVAAVHYQTGAKQTLTNPGGGHFTDATCSPVDSDAVYYDSGTQLKKQLISTGSVSTYKDFGVTLGFLGGSIDRVDLTGRYFVVNLSSNSASPQFRVWDSQTDTLFSGTLTTALGGGYCGISSDGNYVVIVSAGPVIKSYAVNKGTQTLSTTGVTIQSDTGSHGDLLSASDGHSYFVRASYDTNPGTFFRSDLATGTKTDFFTFAGPGPSNRDYHSSVTDHWGCISSGPNQDWVVGCSGLQTGPNLASDAVASSDPITPWGIMQQEVYMVNILTGALRRLGHHRSRQINDNYQYNLRTTVDWQGQRIAYANNGGVLNGESDLFTLEIPT